MEKTMQLWMEKMMVTKAETMTIKMMTMMDREDDKTKHGEEYKDGDN